MKYLSAGGFQAQPLMRLTLGLALVLLAGFWASNLALYLMHMSLNPASVVAYYRGDEARFLPPRSAQGLLEVTHAHLPMFALVLLLLTHLMIFLPGRTGTKAALIVVTFASALVFEAAGWMTRFWSPACAWLKVISFLVLQGTLAWLIVGIGWALARPAASPARPALPRDAP